MTGSQQEYVVHPIGYLRSPLRALSEAPRQGSEGAPDAWLEVDSRYERALGRLSAGDNVIILTWLHLADRAVQEVHPRDDPSVPLHGVFATRSQDRPNPVGLHRVTVREVVDTWLRVGPIEAIDGTPVIDVKIVLDRGDDS
jgi:tRNA-Thr(GGU) m(6)t(6)A37 methyltransferase TsaA